MESMSVVRKAGEMGMSDMEKTIKEMTVLRNWLLHMEEFNASGNGDMYHEFGCTVYNVLELLKEQEAVKPHYNPRSNWYECGACRYSMTSGMHCRSELIPAYKVGFCAKCGKAVKWE